MPLLKRLVWPGHVSRVPLVEELVRDESGRVYSSIRPATNPPQDLDSFTNLTLSNLISQLSSLSRHAEDLFGEMIAEATVIFNRTASLQGRVDKLSVKVKILDSNVEEVSLQDIHMRKAFKSSTMFDQQVVNRETLPVSMLEKYQMCEQPPPLHELNPYRDDGKDGLKFYTDPSYFFNLWREEMKQETERLKHDKKQKPSKPKSDGRSKNKTKNRKPPRNRQEEYKQKVIKSGEVISENVYRAPHNDQVVYDHTTIIDGRPLRPNSIEVRNQYPQNYPQENAPKSPQAVAHRPPKHDYTVDSGYGQPYYQSAYNKEQQYNDYSMSYTQQNDHSASMSDGRNNISRTGVSLRPSQPPPLPPSGENTPTPPSSIRGDTPTRSRGVSQGREHLPPPPPPPGMIGSGIPQMNNGMRHSTQDLPPPPPSPEKMDLPPPSPPPPPPNHELSPPPPPPLPNGNGPIPVAMNANILANGDIKQGLLALKKPVDRKSARPVQNDARSDLLKAIRDGIKLRKVEDQRPKQRDDFETSDVASILQRRLVLEHSDTESSQSSDSDSDQWDDAST